ncbi:MAG: crotonase/enoyl-CoA hydratase family protein [Burkholderiales bacterium]
MNAPVDIKAMEGMFQHHYRQIEVSFDPDHAVAWTFFKPIGVPCFNLGLLSELRAHDAAIEASGGRLLFRGELRQIRYYVAASKTGKVFNLGGDLALFQKLVTAGDRDALMNYAKLCIDNMYPRICNYNSPMTTISLVQGEALGGGFETALSSNVLIAERQARMGMPEILFNLFPGMGAYSLLARRVGMKRAEELILSGRIFTAEEMHQMGIVDLLVEDGTGESAVRDFVRKHERRRNGMQAVFNCRQHFHRVTYDEMLNITNVWVDAAMRLQEKDLKLMSRLVRSQLRFVQNGATPELPTHAARSQLGNHKAGIALEVPGYAELAMA